MSPFGLPKLPGIGESPLSAAGNFIKESIGSIKKLAKDIDDGLGTIDGELSKIGKLDAGSPDEPRQSISEGGVSDDSTYRFQLDLLIDNLADLETIHLPNKGRINGDACDCITKHARILRAHAKETIPIATRQGKGGRIFAEIAKVADHLMTIGTKQAVESGRYDDEYLSQSGAVSNYRKQLEDLLGQSHTSYAVQCATCPSTLNLKEFIDKRNTAEARRESGVDKKAEVTSETEAEQ